jgi:hypothetical protein
MKTSVVLSCLALLTCPALGRCQAPTIEDVVADPADYAGQTLVFRGVALSGNITRYDLVGVRKYYLTVQTPGRVLEAGFFLAPPALADKLYNTMNPRENYNANVTCKVAQISINSVPQWHGIVTAVDFVGRDGRVIETVKLGNK